MKYFFSLWKGINSKNKIVHILSWLTGLILINIPSFETTLGLFHSDDYSLFIPSIYGTFFNMVLFYGSAHLLSLFLKKNTKLFWKQSILLFVKLGLLEAFLDIVFYYWFYSRMNTFLLWEIFIGTVLMNGVFFYLPSFVYGFILEWQESSPKEKSERIQIKSGINSFQTKLNEIYLIESEGNYCTYTTASQSIVVRKSLSQIEKDLPSQFVRCHKSYIINTELVDKISYSEVTIKSINVPIGRKYRDDVKSILNS